MNRGSRLSSDGYVISFIGGGAANSPADSTTYYFGTDTESGLHTVYANISIRVPKAGTIKTFFLNIIKNVNGSGEAVQHYLRINDLTDYPVSLTQTYSAVVDKIFVQGLGIPVANGDAVGIKIVTPAWVTNPTGVRWYGYIHIS
jgi:hypothetical protein